MHDSGQTRWNGIRAEVALRRAAEAQQRRQHYDHWLAVAMLAGAGACTLVALSFAVFLLVWWFL